MQPLAIVVLGGLLVGTLLTLLFIPVVYTVFEEKMDIRRANKAAKAAARLN